MKLNWKNILQLKTPDIGSLEGLADIAFRLGYDFVLWNDRIYKVFFEHPIVITNDTGLTIDDINDVIETQNVVVACRAADGCPVLVVFEVEYTEAEYNLGVHYDKAIELAEEDGYEAPFICFDENEQSEIIAAAKIIDN